jgi:hypothetical protein
VWVTYHRTDVCERGCRPTLGSCDSCGNGMGAKKGKDSCWDPRQGVANSAPN